jgi:hypothetical protein
MRAECQRLVTEAKGGVDVRPATVRIQTAREGKAKTKKVK